METLRARLRAWFLAEPEGNRMPGLDVLRGLLALAVATYHLSVWTELFPTGSRANMAVSKLGNFGVSTFFVLSGFLLFRFTPWEKLRREGFARFYLRRWLRLAPVFYLAVGLNVAFALGMGPEASPRFVLENLTFAFGAIHPNHALVTGGWYVGLVALLYAAYPPLAWARARWGYAFLLSLLLVLAACSLPATLHRVMEAPLGDRFHLYVQPGNQLFLFALGALLAELHGRLAWRLSWRGVLALAALPLWGLLRPVPLFYDHLVALTGWLRYRYLGFAALVLLLAALQGGRSGLCGRLLARVGAWSYGLYLLHPFTHRAAVALGLTGWTAFAAALLAALAAAACAERWLERPLAGLGRGA